ncbi:MAG: S-layer family protein, partial [Stigonema ocellatum SAG 48.90 = DSM 106950]|nr:S-layer family protein [Stigonema ocellatum SAG 48.90 = DSM 106950]
NIDGLIRTLYTANLFVINPNGIVFGPNARLNVGGSFVATTANAIQFGNQGFFSADVPNNPALLTINPNALLFNQIAAAPIQNNSRASAGKNPVTGLDANGLGVPDGKSLLLVGGDINMDGGKLVAFGGRVELGGLAATGTVGLNVDGNLLSLSFPNNLEQASVSLSNDSNVDVSSGGSGSGSITINARNVTFGNSSLTAVNAGNVNINARNAVSLDGATLFAATNGNQNAGSVTINAGDSVSLNNGSNISSQVQKTGIGNGGVISINTRALSLTNGGGLFADTNGAGSAGSVTIHAGDSVSLNGSNISSQVQGNVQGNGGVISINTRALSLTNGAQLLTNTDGAGAAGSVIINASDRVSLENGSGVYDSANSNAMGNSGGISITTGTLSLTNGATLFAATDGNQNAGSVTIHAGDSVSLNGSNIFSQVQQTGIGNGGVISIKTRALELTNGAGLRADTDGAGSAGSVIINASDHVFLENGSSVYNTANSNAIGNSGGISITTGTLLLTNGAQLNTLTSGQGNAGNISITTGTLSLTNGATLFANTAGNGNAGSVTINAGDSVSLNNGSSIFSNVQENAQGNGGVISIHTRALELTNGAGLRADTNGAGAAGSVNLNASDRVSLENGSGVYNNVNSNAVGNSGGISITTGTLSLTNGAQLNTATSGQANAGDIILEASDRVSFDNSRLFTSAGETATGKGGNVNINSRDISFANGTILTLATSGKGDAGNATIMTRSLSLTDGSLLTASSNNSAGKAGNISIENAEFVSLSGNNPINRRSTEISSDTRGTSTGSAGNITIDAAAFRVSDGAIINARTTSSGTGGSITINSKTFEATNGGELITTSKDRASAGNITVNATDRVIVNGSDRTVNERRIAFKATGEDLGNVESASGFFALSSSSASAGEIKVSAPQIRLDNQGKFSANS